MYRQLVIVYFDNDRPIAECVRSFFDDGAALLEATDFQDACPIATIAMEVSNSNDGMRRAAAAAFESWISVIVDRLRRDGYSDANARALAVQMFCGLEGAFTPGRLVPPQRSHSRAWESSPPFALSIPSGDTACAGDGNAMAGRA